MVEKSSPSEVELYASIEPMHGNNVVYNENKEEPGVGLFSMIVSIKATHSWSPIF